jgi:hypothetical protein
LEHIGRWEIYGEIQGAGRPVDPFFSGRLNIASCSTPMLQKLQSLRAPRAISVKFSDQNYAFHAYYIVASIKHGLLEISPFI